MSVVAISGAQGQGKSTILAALEAEGYQTIPNKTSRTILSEWGMSLNEVNKYAPLTKIFQEEILARHSEYMAPYIESHHTFFIERSFADIFTYCLFQLGPYNEYNEWVKDYYIRCQEQQQKLLGVIYLSGRTYTPEEDGVRSTNPFFSAAVDKLIYHHLTTFDIPTNKVLLVDQSDHVARLNLIRPWVAERRRWVDVWGIRELPAEELPLGQHDLDLAAEIETALSQEIPMGNP